MEEINLKSMFNYFCERLKFIIYCLIISFFIGVIYTFIFNLGNYESESKLTINTNDLNNIKELTTSYASKLVSADNINAVIENLKLDYSVFELLGMITVKSNNDSGVLSVYVDSNNASESYKINNELCNVFINKVKLDGVDNIYVLQKATKPTNKSVSLGEHIKDILLVTIFGIFISCLYIFIRFYYSGNIMSKEELDLIGLNLYGVIPKLKGSNISKYNQSLMNIKSSIDMLGKKKVIMITATSKNVDRSTIVNELANIYSKNDSVIVVDVDFTHKNYEESGYTELINDIDNISHYINKTDNKNIDRINNGKLVNNQIELLTSDNNAKLFRKLKKQYDYIILDTAPIIGITGTKELIQYTDINLIVIEHENTSIELLKQTKNIFEDTDSKTMGVIINKNNSKIHNCHKDYYNK